MKTALLIARKDLRQRFRDRSVFLIALVVPLALASIFGLIFHDAAGGITCDCNFALVDQDRGAAAQAFETQALQPLERRGLITVAHEPSLAAGRHAAATGAVGATFVLPAGFTRAVAAGRAATILVVGNADSPITVQVGEAVARSYASHADTMRIAQALVGSASQEQLQTVARAEPIAIADVSTKSKQLDVGTFYSAGMAVFFLFFTVQYGISSILDEGRTGTLARMLAAPIPRGAVLVGKLVTSVVLGVISMAVLALTTRFLLGAHWGNPLAVAILIVCGVLSATAVMSVVATVARSVDEAQTLQSVVALVLGMLGGTFFRVAQAGGVVATLSDATPQAWFLRGIQNLAGGAGVHVVLGPALAILAIGAVAAAVATLRANRLVPR
jgi:linearmycin/streptolysin S transport system permease protein